MMRMEKQRSKASRFTSPSFSAVHVFLVLIIGYCFGHYQANRSYENHPDNSHVRGSNQENSPVLSGSFQQLDSVPVRPTSHVDDKGRPITKQQLVDPFVLPRLAGISVATFQPGQIVSLHQHESMHEFFFILQGKATFRIEKPLVGSTKERDQQVVEVSKGSFVHCAPHEKHEIVGPSGPNDEPMKMFVVGVTLD